MRKEIVTFFSDEEDEAIDLLMSLGFKKKVAAVLVFLRNTDKVTSREIERGTDLGSSEVCLAMQYLRKRQWIDVRREIKTKGHFQNVYQLALPFPKIAKIAIREKNDKLKDQLARLRKMKNTV